MSPGSDMAGLVALNFGQGFAPSFITSELLFFRSAQVRPLRDYGGGGAEDVSGPHPEST